MCNLETCVSRLVPEKNQDEASDQIRLDTVRFLCAIFCQQRQDYFELNSAMLLTDCAAHLET